MTLNENFSLGVTIVILIILVILGIGLIFLLLALFLSNIMTGAPFVKSKKAIVKKIKESNILKPKTLFCDLGSGDGAFLYELAKEFSEVQFVGYEKNILLYFFAKTFNRRPNLRFKHADFFRVDLSKFDYVYLFLMPSLMDKLAPKLKKNLKKGALIISNSFAFKNWQTIKVLESPKTFETLYFYQL